MVNLRLILGLVAALVLVSFGVKNMHAVSVAYSGEKVLELPLFYVVLVFFSAGFLLALAGGVVDRLRVQRQIRRFRQRVRDLESELQGLREKNGLLPPTSSAEGAPSLGSALSIYAPKSALPSSFLGPKGASAEKGAEDATRD